MPSDDLCPVTPPTEVVTAEPLRYGRVGERSLDRGAQMRELAGRVGLPPARLAVAWMLAGRARWPVIPVLGARSVAQLEDTLVALDGPLGADDLAALDQAFAIALGFPHDFLDSDDVRDLIHGDLATLLDR